MSTLTRTTTQCMRKYALIAVQICCCSVLNAFCCPGTQVIAFSSQALYYIGFPGNKSLTLIEPVLTGCISLGLAEVDVDMPILGSIENVRFFALYLGESRVCFCFLPWCRSSQRPFVMAGLVLSVILTILFILSTMLIYCECWLQLLLAFSSAETGERASTALLMISIETRTFELGVHRMVSHRRRCAREGILPRSDFLHFSCLHSRSA
jgi:hypothetical protein